MREPVYEPCLLQEFRVARVQPEDLVLQLARCYLVCSQYAEVARSHSIALSSTRDLWLDRGVTKGEKRAFICPLRERWGESRILRAAFHYAFKIGNGDGYFP